MLISRTTPSKQLGVLCHTVAFWAFHNVLFHDKIFTAIRLKTRIWSASSMKRKTAREILAESFRELAGSKPVDRITVPNIIENCGYSKTTFYRLFKDKYDLMAWDYAQKLQTIVDQTANADYEWKQILWDVALLYNEYFEGFGAVTFVLL